MKLNLRAGRRYVRRNGDVSGPLVGNNDGDDHPFYDGTFHITATGGLYLTKESDLHDLVAEFVEGLPDLHDLVAEFVEGLPDGVPQPPHPPEGMRWEVKGWGGCNGYVGTFITFWKTMKQWGEPACDRAAAVPDMLYLLAVPDTEESAPEEKRERRFRLKGGFPRGERYVVVYPDGRNGYVSKEGVFVQTGSAGDPCGYPIEYCERQVRTGSWEELSLSESPEWSAIGHAADLTEENQKLRDELLEVREAWDKDHKEMKRRLDDFSKAVAEALAQPEGTDHHDLIHGIWNLRRNLCEPIKRNGIPVTREEILRILNDEPEFT